MLTQTILEIGDPVLRSGPVPEVDPTAGRVDLVQLDGEHPGFRDQIYRKRRNAIARLALDYRLGDPVPSVDYGEAEEAVWRTVWDHLRPLHAARAAEGIHEANRLLSLDRSGIAQLAEVNQSLARLSGFQMIPVAGLVASRTFLSYLGRGLFLSTQYVRHSARPLYTPEPDVIHELVGHAATLAHPRFADLNRRFGRAADRVDDTQLTQLARAYWFTMEFGLLREGTHGRAYGAGLLSSASELGTFEQRAKIRPFAIDAVIATDFDTTDYQRELFVAESFAALEGELIEWLDGLGR